MGADALERDDDNGRPGTLPERTCIVTRAKLAPDELIRFVRAPDGQIVPDLACRLPGRGVWVTCDREHVAEAARRNTFARSLKQSVIVPDDLAGRVEQLLQRRMADALSFTVKAGLAIAGFTKVENLIDKGDAVVLIHAADGAPDGVAKLDRKFRAIRGALAEGQTAEIVTELGCEELSLAMGRAHVVHAALAKGGAAQNFLKEARRLRRYRSHSSSEAARPPISGSDTEQA